MIESLLWKETYEYDHPDANETVVLKRNRLTGNTRRVWYKHREGWDFNE